jgi:hypothetical protein
MGETGFFSKLFRILRWVIAQSQIIIDSPITNRGIPNDVTFKFRLPALSATC